MGKNISKHHSIAPKHFGETPLMISANKGDYENVQLLVKKGEDVNACTKYNTTVLMYAVAKHGNYEIVTYLLQAGVTICNVLQENKKGYTALCLAQKNDDQDMCEILKEFIYRNADNLEQRLKLVADELKVELYRCFTKHLETTKQLLSNSCKEISFSVESNPTDLNQIDYYTKLHSEYVRQHNSVNIKHLIKGAPCLGETFVVYTSSVFALLDKSYLDKFVACESIYYPRVMKTTWDVSKLNVVAAENAPPLIFLVIKLSFNFLFSSDNIVYSAPRFLTVERVMRHSHYIVVYLY